MFSGRENSLSVGLPQPAEEKKDVIRPIPCPALNLCNQNCQGCHFFPAMSLPWEAWPIPPLLSRCCSLFALTAPVHFPVLTTVCTYIHG